MFSTMNKKLICIFLSLVMLFALTACEKDDVSTEGDMPCEVLLVTDYGTITDGSFNQGCWEGLQKFASQSGKTIDHYQPDSTNLESFMAQIKRGVKNGAQVIVCPGYLMEETVYEAQKKYPDTTFILLDGQPHNADYTDYTIGSNVKSILFAEEEAGFLAGYSAVRDGYKNLGFMGGVPEDAVIRYGYGFVQGADYAAIEMGVEVHIRYTYMNTFNDEPIIETTAKTWFDDDTEVIFACGGSIGNGVILAAENHDGKVIGVDIDQSSQSETVITSAVKSLADAVCTAVTDYYNGTFVGGVSDTLTAKENGICLPMETSRFQKFTQDDYNSIYQRIVDGMIVPYSGTNIATTQELTLINTTVSYIVAE